MPLTLLSKKSWNVYNPENIARVKKDQAQAKAREEEADRQLDEQDAARRLAILRGEVPPSALPEPETQKPDKRSLRESGDRKDDRRKRKRRAGEDDTEQELRLARENLGSRHEARGEKRKRSDAPITDRDGHINLFPLDEHGKTQSGKDKEVEAEKARKQRELEDQYTMRFSNAAGRDGLKVGPWYASQEARERREDEERSKNAFGRPDPARKDREIARQSSNDPLAFMQKAQVQLKRAEKDREQSQRTNKMSKANNLMRQGEEDQRTRKREKAEISEESRRAKELSKAADDAAEEKKRTKKEERRKYREDKERMKRKKERSGHGSELRDDFRLDG